MNAVGAWLFCLAALTQPSPSPSATPAPLVPMRHMSYAFTFSSNGNQEIHDAGGLVSGQPNPFPATSDNASAGALDANTSGAAFLQTYQSSLSDRGTIDVDVYHEFRDSGLLVSVSEHGLRTRNSPEAKCAVYGDSVTVVCEPGKVVNSEELTLLRYLGTTFVSPAKMSAEKNWNVDLTTQNEWTVANFSVRKRDHDLLTIDEMRTVKGINGKAGRTDVSSNIEYDWDRLLPLKVHEYAVTRQNQGDGSIMTTTTITTLDLQYDSAH